MIYSKFRASVSFKVILSVFLLLILCFVIFCLVSVFFFDGHIVVRGTLPVYGAVIFIILLLFLVFLVINSWIRYTFSIVIDQPNKTISFKNIITRKCRIYIFTDFDGYIDTTAYTRYEDAYKVIYLIKNKKAEKIITGFYYSNVDELQSAITSIKYLGFDKNFSRLARKTFCNKPIID